MCSNAGGSYNALTKTYAGSDGTNDNCDAVMTALNAPGDAVFGGCPFDTSPIAVGCHSQGAERYRCTEATTAGANASGVRRACACN